MAIMIGLHHWSYIWNSQQHLSSAAFWSELLGAAIELGVSAIIVITFHKEWDEKVKRRIEFLFEVGFLIAALIAVVAIISNRRIETLREGDEKTAADNATLQAEKLADAKAKVEELEKRTMQRKIRPEDKNKFIQLLKNSPKGRVQVQVSGDCGEEIAIYATAIRKMIASAGYTTPPGNAHVFDQPSIPKGVFVIVANATNQPPFAGSIQQALKAIGINAEGYICGPNAALAEDQVRIYIGSKP